MYLGRKIAASLATAALGLSSSACAADLDTGGDPKPSAQASSSAPVDMKKCLALQRRYTLRVRGRLQNITEGVLAEPDRVPPDAVEGFARDIRKAVEATSEVC